MSAFSDLPIQESIPAEMMVGNLGSAIPKGTKRTVVRTPFNNSPSVKQTITTPALPAIAVGQFNPTADYSFSQKQLLVDIECNQGRTVWLDTRTASIMGRILVKCESAGTAPTQGFLRSSAYSFFDTMRIRSGTEVVEEIQEYGGIADMLLNLQQGWGQRMGVANLYGYSAPAGETGSQGLNIKAFGDEVAPVANAYSSVNFNIPVLSGLFCGNDRFLNIGAIKKLQLELMTTNVLPITVVQWGTTATQTGATFSIELTDLYFQADLVEIPEKSEMDVLSTINNGISYLHGTSYKSSSNTLSAGATSTQNLSYGLTVASCKSLFCRFYDTAYSTNGSINNKYDSKNPSLTGIQLNIGSQKYPQSVVNPLLYPSEAFRDLQMAIGNYNTASYSSSILPQNYCKLSQGGTSSFLNTSTLTTQDMKWNLQSHPEKQCQFFWGMNLERVNKKGILSGMDLSTAKVILEMTVGTANTNPQTIFLYAMVDIVFVLDYNTGRLYSIS